MSANDNTSTEATVTALATDWRAINSRPSRPDISEEECSADCDAADKLAWWIAHTPAASMVELSAKLHVYVEETEPGMSAVGDALLSSIVADAVRLSTVPPTELARALGTSAGDGIRLALA